MRKLSLAKNQLENEVVVVLVRTRDLQLRPTLEVLAPEGPQDHRVKKDGPGCPRDFERSFEELNGTTDR